METRNEDIAYEMAMLVRKNREQSEALNNASNKILQLEQENADLHERLECSNSGGNTQDLGMISGIKEGDKIVITYAKPKLLYKKGYVVSVSKTPYTNSYGIVCIGVFANNMDISRTIRSTNYKWAKVNENTPLSTHRWVDGEIEYKNIISV